MDESYPGLKEFKHHKMDYHLTTPERWGDGDIADAHKEGWEQGYNAGVSYGIRMGKLFAEQDKEG
jgi:hypothetical protein